MQKSNELERNLVAPGPTIPTYRPSSQSSKRANYTMAALAPKYQQYLSMADDIHPTDTSSAGASNEKVSEIVRYLQTYTSSQGSSQSTGARDMIKAGQRRLRLALRNKKGADSKAKPDDASRQLAALQHEESFPRSQYRKYGHKKSTDSTSSHSKSVSDLGFRSNSKRDVETIGQPWLENPLESREAPGSKGSSLLSSLDLRDLVSFVEAAVDFSSHFEDHTPPPYQPPTGQPPKPTTAATPNSEHISQSDVVPVGNTNPPSNLGRNSSDQPSTSSKFPGSTHTKVSTEKHISGNQPLEEPKLKGGAGTITRQVSPSNSSTCSKNPSAPTTPTLKLFPDTMHARISSKGALRIPNGRSPTPNLSLPPTPGSQRGTTFTAVSEPVIHDSKVSRNSLPKIHEDVLEAREVEHTTSTRPERPSGSSGEDPESEVTLDKNTPRPSSFSSDTIDAFPLPVPIRPLPLVPRVASQSSANGSQESHINRQPAQIDLRRQELGPTVNTPPYISVLTQRNSEDSKTPSHGRASPSPRLLMSGKSSVTTQDTAAVNQPRRGSLGKGERSREDKVRSLIMRDLAAGRVRLNRSNKSQNTELRRAEARRKEQVSLSHRGDEIRLNAYRHYQRKVSPGPSSLPPSSPPPVDPPRHQLQGRHYCTSPASSKATTVESGETLSRSAYRNPHVHRSTSIRSVDPRHERAVMERNIPDRAETPLPSSDDEGPAGDFYWNSSRMTFGRRRRAPPAPIVIDEPASLKGRSLKKRPVYNNISPPAAQGHRGRGPEKTTHVPRSSSDYQTSNTHRSYAPESKPNLSLEGRIEHLERQNKILQAALLAALDVGVKQDLSSLLGGPAMSLSTNTTPPLTSRSVSSTTNTSTPEAPSVVQDSCTRNDTIPYPPESWISSPHSFEKAGYDSDDSTEARELEEMMEDFDLDWL